MRQDHIVLDMYICMCIISARGFLVFLCASVSVRKAAIVNSVI